MDIEELKWAWLLKGKNSAEQIDLTEQHIGKAIKNRANLELDKLLARFKQRFFLYGFGTIGCLMLGIDMVISSDFNFIGIELDYFLNREQIFLIFFLFFLTVLFMAVFVFHSINTISRFKKNTNINIKKSLWGSIELIKRMMVVNIYSDTIIVPCLLSFILYMGYLNGLGSMGYFLTGVCFVGIGLLSFTLNKRGQLKTFRPYLEILSGYLDELQQEENTKI